MSQAAAFSYAPGQPCYGLTFTRASTANQVPEASDLAFVYWPGALHCAETFTRASTANYTNETKYPAS